MTSAINTNVFPDNVEVTKANLRGQFDVAASEITGLQERVTLLEADVDVLAGSTVVPVTPTSLTGILIIDLGAVTGGPYFDVILTENITQIQVVNALANKLHDFRVRFKQAAASSFTVDFADFTINGTPATASWAVVPVMTATFNKFDFFGFRIYPDSITTIYGFTEAQGR